MKAVAFILLLTCLLLLSSSARSGRLTQRSALSIENRPHRNPHSKAEFTFARPRYEGIGRRESWTTEQLSPAQGQELQGLVERARLFDQPAKPGARSTPDQFQYEIRGRNIHS
jgi:hypothetical protein